MRFDPVKSNSKAWTNGSIALVVLVGLGVIGLIVYSAWGGATLSYAITASHVEIEYGPSLIQIPRAEIEEVRILDQVSGGRRLFGTSMPGLRQGVWSFRETGRITLYATTLDRLVVIVTQDGQWGISPEDPEGFVRALETGGAANFEPPRQRGSWGIVALGMVPLFSFALVFVIIVPFARIAGRFYYELANDAVLIHGESRPIKLPYAEITSVEVKQPEGRPRKWFGASLPGFYWGDFSWRAAGPNLRLYASSLRPLVVISSGRRTFGLSPAEPEKFVAELKRRLGRP